MSANEKNFNKKLEDIKYKYQTSLMYLYNEAKGNKIYNTARGTLLFKYNRKLTGYEKAFLREVKSLIMTREFVESTLDIFDKVRDIRYKYSSEFKDKYGITGKYFVVSVMRYKYTMSTDHVKRCLFKNGYNSLAVDKVERMATLDAERLLAEENEKYSNSYYFIDRYNKI